MYVYYTTSSKFSVVTQKKVANTHRVKSEKLAISVESPYLLWHGD